VDIQEIRRARLKAWIANHYDGNVSQFAEAAKRPQPRIADVLAGRKKFGEKLARAIEIDAKIPPWYLDDKQPIGAGGQAQMLYGTLISSAGVLLGAEWEKLDVKDRIEMEQEIQARVARKVRTTRKGPSPSQGKDKD
jgi:hypothetical protein